MSLVVVLLLAIQHHRDPAPVDASVDELLPTCSMISFPHIPKTGGTSIRAWLARLRLLYGYGFLSTYDKVDSAALPSVDEWNGKDKHMLLFERWRLELSRLPANTSVPARQSWRVGIEWHDRDHSAYKRFLRALPTLWPLARSHNCYVAVVSVVREPLAYFVSHLEFMVGRYNVWRRDMSLEAYVQNLGNHQTKWLSSKSPIHTEALLRDWVGRHIDVLGTTDRMGDFVRAVCQAAGLPPTLCPSGVQHKNNGSGLCFRYVCTPHTHGAARIGAPRT